MFPGFVSPESTFCTKLSPFCPHLSSTNWATIRHRTRNNHRSNRIAYVGHRCNCYGSIHYRRYRIDDRSGWNDVCRPRPYPD